MYSPQTSQSIVIQYSAETEILIPQRLYDYQFFLLGFLGRGIWGFGSNQKPQATNVLSRVRTLWA